jgi:hypothetical protein
MNDYRVTVTWTDGERTTHWVDAPNERLAILAVGTTLTCGPDMLRSLVQDIVAVIETN